MYKSVNEIKDYTVRNRFVRNLTHTYEWETHLDIIDNQYPDLSYLKNWEIEEMTYFLWEVKQKKLIKNWIEIEHSSLKGHELWVPKESRKDFKEWQTKIDEVHP
jgi:hypothetical protein